MTDEKCFNRAITVEVIVGLFVSLVFIALGIFTIVISGSKLFNNHQYPIRVAFENAMGLRRNDPVIARGTPVGTVDDVYYDRDKVYVKAMLTTPVVFREGYKVSVQTTSILGGRQLVISEGDPARAEVEDVENLLGAPPSDIMDDASAVIKYLRDFLAGDFLENLDATGDNLAQVSGRLARGEGTLGKLLSSDDTVYQDLKEAVANIRSISTRLEAGEGTLGKLLSSDPAIYDDLKAAMASVKDVAGRLERGEGTLGKLLSSDDTVYQDLRETVANLRSISTRLEKGEGSLGKLLSSDTGLYDNINGAVSDVREVIDDMRETSPVSTFSSFIFGAF